jgi:hypothetical protein
VQPRCFDLSVQGLMLVFLADAVAAIIESVRAGRGSSLVLSMAGAALFVLVVWELQIPQPPLVTAGIAFAVWSRWSLLCSPAPPIPVR